MVAAVLKTYGWFHYRVCWMGDLPPGPLVIIANHAHDADSVTLPVNVMLRQGTHHPLISSGSQRLFEPGFLAERLGPVLGPWLVWFNVGPILWRLGVRPIEDSPLHHSLRSWGYLVHQEFGDRRLDEVFVPEVLTARPGLGPLKLHHLWSRRSWRWAEQRFGVRALVEPYRRVMRERVRTRLESQLGLITDAINRGFSVYTTPEGRLTQDGRLYRFRESWRVVTTANPRSICIAATTYDAFKAGRLAIWTALGPPRWSHQLARSVSVARPITASHLASVIWHNSDPSTARPGLVEAALAELSRLPSCVTVADNLLSSPAAVLGERFAWLEKQGRRPGGVVRDARFPWVSDMVSYYVVQYQEIVTDATGSRLDDANAKVNRNVSEERDGAPSVHHRQ